MTGGRRRGDKEKGGQRVCSPGDPFERNVKTKSRYNAQSNGPPGPQTMTRPPRKRQQSERTGQRGASSGQGAQDRREQAGKAPERRQGTPGQSLVRVRLKYDRQRTPRRDAPESRGVSQAARRSTSSQREGDNVTNRLVDATDHPRTITGRHAG